MAHRNETTARRLGQGWLATLVGIFVLVVGGFVLGLAVGVVFEEPELVAGHVAGRSTEIEWAAARAPGDSSQDAQAWFSGEDQASSKSVAKAPPVAAAPPVATPESPSQEFLIQVGAFADQSSARGLAQRLRKGGYPVRVMEPDQDDRWRVRVGPVPGRLEADEVALQLKSEEELPTWVLRGTGS